MILKVSDDCLLARDLGHSSLDLSGFLGGKAGTWNIALFEEGLNLGEIGRVGNEGGESLAHASFSEHVGAIELLPELLLDRHGSCLCD